MQHGFEGTSMRQLTSRGVNLAAVNYHFGSKDALIEAVFRRRLDPMNAARIAALDELEKEGRAAAPRRSSARSSDRACMIEDGKGGGRNFIRLLGRTYTDPAKGIRTLIGQMYAPAMERYKRALQRALPQMPPTSSCGACISCSAPSPTRSPPPTRCSSSPAASRKTATTRACWKSASPRSLPPACAPLKTSIKKAA